VARDFAVTAPRAKMVGDITGVPTWEGWLFLATVIDCHNKEVIGWATDDNNKTPLIVSAIDMVARNRIITPGAVFHTDRRSNIGLNRWSRHCLL
jgi:putative transposase